MIPQIEPPHVTPHILMKVVSKFHSPSPSSLGGVRRKPPPGIKRFSFTDMYRRLGVARFFSLRNIDTFYSSLFPLPGSTFEQIIFLVQLFALEVVKFVEKTVLILGK